MKLGFTGTRKGMTGPQRADFWITLRSLELDEFHHGGCLGADEDAHAMANKLGVEVVIHPGVDAKGRSPYSFAPWPDCRAFPPKPYLQRNRVIVDMTDMLIACPDGEERLRSGTWSTVRYALTQGRSVFIIYPSGRTELR